MEKDYRDAFRTDYKNYKPPKWFDKSTAPLIHSQLVDNMRIKSRSTRKGLKAGESDE